MKAARLNKIGEPLHIEEIPDPKLRAGGVIVKVLSSQMMSYTHEVMSGSAARIAPPIPYTPGLSAIGVVEAVADDVIGLDIGQKVFCSPHVVVQPNGRPPESMLIGWFGLTSHADKLLAMWKNGAFAEKALYPAECVTPLDGVESVAAEYLACLNILTVAYGALLKGPLRSGKTVVVNGATGNIGACVVLLALIMGAAKAVAVGRHQPTLAKLQLLDARRVVVAPLEGDLAAYAHRINEAAGGADLVVDASAAHTHEPTVACLNTLSPHGTAVFVGGVRADIPLPYMDILRKELTIRGSYMYPRFVPGELVRMIATGMLDLRVMDTHVFPLDDINSAIAQASHLRGLACCVIVP